MNSVVLITENSKISKFVKSKIILLRESDDFKDIEYYCCFEKVKELHPSVIFYHLTKNNEEDFFKFLTKLKQTTETKTISVILLFEDFDEDVLCSAFELGITDFLTVTSSETEFTVRTIWCLQKNQKSLENQNKSELLSELKILDDTNNVYTSNYSYNILKEEANKNKGTLALIAPDINVRNKISPDSLVNVIKNSVRSCDIIGFAQDFKIYLWLKNTNKKDALGVLNKIQKNLTHDFTICAGYTEINNKNFEKAEVLTSKALSKALLKGNLFLYAQEKDSENITKNDKQICKNIETLLSPIFFQYQKRNEERLFETKISQKVGEQKSFFKLENENGFSSLNVNCSDNKNIDIEIFHNIKDMELLADKICLNSNEINEEQIENILNSFIKEFQSYTKC